MTAAPKRLAVFPYRDEYARRVIEDLRRVNSASVSHALAIILEGIERELATSGLWSMLA